MGAIAAICSAGNEGEGAVARGKKDSGHTKDLQHNLLAMERFWCGYIDETAANLTRVGNDGQQISNPPLESQHIAFESGVAMLRNPWWTKRNSKMRRQ